MNLTFFIIALFLILVIALILYAMVAAVGRASERKKLLYGLDRHARNPVITPSANEWEAEGTFNPGAVMDDDGTVHLFYRAIGRDGLSRIGHAVSTNGRDFTDRCGYPVFVPLAGTGMPDQAHAPGPHWYDRSAHASGGGWGGAEDPRVVKIGPRIYMTYTAFQGWGDMRIGLTSILEKDMRAGRWNWRRAVPISPASMRAKNWVLFPEKIRGKYAILHGIAPCIKIAYVDSPDMIPKIESLKDHGGAGYGDPSRKGHWDEQVRGAGAPPIKTDLGWLLLYHAIDARDPKNVVGYKVGAMILDRHDPEKVLYRSPEPILAPDMPYENDGKPGVVYASGAVVKDGTLFVYYGGGDKHTCVAETPLDQLLTWLMAYGKTSA